MPRDPDRRLRIVSVFGALPSRTQYPTRIRSYIRRRLVYRIRLRRLCALPHKDGEAAQRLCQQLPTMGFHGR